MDFQEVLFGIIGQKWDPSIDFIHWHGTLKQFKIEAQQEFLVYVRDFSDYLERITDRNPPQEVVEALKENIAEERYGRISRFNRSHPDLFLDCMKRLGYEESDFKSIGLFPASARYKQWLDYVTAKGSWLEAFAVMAMFVEGLKDEKQTLDHYAKIGIDNVLRQHYLVRHFGLNPRELKLKRAHWGHAQVENDHREKASQIVLKYADSDEKRKAVTGAMENSLKLWKGYRTGIAARVYSL